MSGRWTAYRGQLIAKNPETDEFSRGLTYKKIVAEWRGGSKGRGRPLFCMFPTEFDCGLDTPWWYNIKDTEYEIEKLKANRRYEITKGKKHFVAREFSAADFADEIFEVYEKAFSAYPEKYRPKTTLERTRRDCAASKDCWIGAFSRETGRLCGFLIFSRKKGPHSKADVVSLSSQKAIPECERLNVNFALLDFFLSKFNPELKEKKVILTNGQRNLAHETQFNEFLEKYFGFRKAHAMLHIRFHPALAPLAKLLYICPPPTMQMEEPGLSHKKQAPLQNLARPKVYEDRGGLRKNLEDEE